MHKDYGQMTLISRFFTPPSQSFFLFGPRGTGKSTLMKVRYQNALWIDLLRPDTLRSYLGRPERLYEIVEGHTSGKNGKDSKVIVIDEVQKAPALLPVIHNLIEDKRDLQFVLTGSSSRKLKRTGADLLGGRALRCTLYPFMAAEMGDKFSFTHALSYGLLPLLLDKKNPQVTLNAYINLYLQEEVHSEGLVRNLENFVRFLEAISFSHGSLLNPTNIGRECEVKRKTVENYITILEELLLAFQLTVFTRRAQRELVAHPKFYLFDTGVFRILQPQGPLDKQTEIEGAALEGLVAQHLKAWVDYTTESHSLSFWRTRSGVEVDFIIYGPKSLWAIEVKNDKKVSSKDTKSLEAFLTDYPMAKAILLYRGTEYIKIKNVLCIPCEDFLRQLRPDQELWVKK
jgi:predicted AAA+ superfamily ATPase